MQLDWIHSFYAFGSYSQRDLIPFMHAVSFGWSAMEWSEETGVRLNTPAENNNQWRVPEGYELLDEFLEYVSPKLNVFMDTSTGLSVLLSSEEARTAAVDKIINELNRIYPEIGRNPFNGVTVNFEGLRGEDSQGKLNAFLRELRSRLDINHTLYVTVHPATTDGIYFDGYDYREIGRLADKVILLAHDYYPRSMQDFVGTAWQQNAALTPIEEIRHALEAVTCETSGVEDKSKIAIAFSFPNIGWEICENGLLTSPDPIAVSMETVILRMAQTDTFFAWSEIFRNPYLIYTTENNERIFLWYEDNRSITEKIILANSFGVTGVSLWRLGIIPTDDKWNVGDIWGGFVMQGGF
ncbi:MAG: glycosyl hydrolase family 18 protein [Defluviitaleaceae bacterium]|nr:glycosyl hydrolase family 18 protein [Defluviitaleaceae bacterium]